MFDAGYGTFTKISVFCKAKDGNVKDEPKTPDCITDIQDMHDMHNNCIAAEIKENVKRMTNNTNVQNAETAEKTRITEQGLIS